MTVFPNLEYFRVPDHLDSWLRRGAASAFSTTDEKKMMFNIFGALRSVHGARGGCFTGKHDMARAEGRFIPFLAATPSEKKCIHEPRACPHALSGGCPAQVGSSYDSSRRIRPVCATSAPDSHHLHGHGVSERTRSWDYFRFFSRAEHLAHEKRCWPHSPHTTECGQHLSLSHQWLTQEEKLKKAYAVFATPTTSRC